MTTKIYCIECLETGEKYIGSTINKYLSSRIARHKYDKRCVSSQIIDRGNWKYYLLEEVDKSQRLIREQYYMDNTDKCINYQRAIGHTKKEWFQLNKERINKKTREKITCECGAEISYGNRLRHIKSKKHQEYTASKTK